MLQASSKQYLSIGILASIIVGIGEYLLHYTPEGPEGEIAMLEVVPLARASIGHFLVVFGAPLYFLGYYGIEKMFHSTSAILARSIFFLGVLAFSIGGVWVSSRYFAAEVLQGTAGTPYHEKFLASYEYHYQSLVWVLRILVLAISAIYIILVLKNIIGIPKWIAILNPIVLLAIAISSLFWMKPIGVHIAPIAMNAVHFIVFIILRRPNRASKLYRNK